MQDLTQKHCKTMPKIYSAGAYQKRKADVIFFAQENAKKYYKKYYDYCPSLDKKRSERREAIASLLSVLANHTDLATMQIVKVHAGELKNISNSDLRAMSMLTVDRYNRALKDLKEAGYITVKQLSHHYDDKAYGNVAIKSVSKSMFIELGVKYEKLQSCIDYAKKREGKLTKRQTIQANLNKLAVLDGRNNKNSSLTATILAKSAYEAKLKAIANRPQNKIDTLQAHVIDHGLTKEEMLLAMQIRMADKTISPDDAKRLAKERLRAIK